MSTTAGDKLLWRPAPRTAPVMRLFCFAYAGAGASAYRLWPAILPPEIELIAIQLPGRESRLRETPLESIADIVAAIQKSLLPRLDLPFAFFGHSMGAVVAFEVARSLARDGFAVPDHLFLSARRPPRVPDPLPPIHALPYGDFIAEVQRRYGGIPAEVLEQTELMELLVPCLRADIKALETHPFEPGVLSAVPITAFGGTNDRGAPRAHLEAWREETSASFRLREFDGDHFYLVPHREQLLAEIVAAVAPLVGRPESELRVRTG